MARFANLATSDLTTTAILYGLGEFGRMLEPLLGRGELGRMLEPLFGRGEFGRMLDPLLRVVNEFVA